MGFLASKYGNGNCRIPGTFRLNGDPLRHFWVNHDSAPRWCSVIGILIHLAPFSSGFYCVLTARVNEKKDIMCHPHILSENGEIRFNDLNRRYDIKTNFPDFRHWVARSSRRYIIQLHNIVLLRHQCSSGKCTTSRGRILCIHLPDVGYPSQLSSRLFPKQLHN